MSDKPVSEMSFEEAMAALEAVVTQLERGEVALEQSIALYERGAALKAHCAAKLAEAEARVELIRAAEGRAVGTEPFPGEGERAAATPARTGRATPRRAADGDDDIPF